MVGLGHCLFQSRIAELRFASDPINESLRPGHVDPAGPYLWAAAEPLKLFQKRIEPVNAAALRVQVHELGCFARIAADTLQLIVIDEIWNEALFVLDFHRIEDAPVRIDAN